jgi:hypothetical protein
MSEEALQRTVAANLRLAMPAGIPWTAIEPAGRGPRDGARQKKKGVNPGWADLQFILPPFGSYLGIELKAKDGSPQGNQKAFRDAVRAMGGDWFVAKSWGDVFYILRHFGVDVKRITPIEKPRPHLVKQIEAREIERGAVA